MFFLYMALIDDKEDQRRFERIYLGYRQRMFEVALRVLRDPMEAEDAVHNALLSIAKTIQTVPTGNEQVEKAYVLTAAKHAALRIKDKKDRWNDVLDVSELALSSGEDLFEQIKASLDTDFLLKAIKELPEQYREVLMLVCVQNLSNKDAACVLQRKESTVRKQLQRGRRLLTQLCGREGMCFEERDLNAL